MNQIILAISGKAYSGKSTLALSLHAAMPHDPNTLFIRSIARPIKTGLWRLTDIGETPENKEQYREGYQWYGNFMRAQHGEDYWVRRMVRLVGIANGDSLIVDDVRLPAELRGLRDIAREHEITFFSARLNITPEEQNRRHIAKHGKPMDEARRNDITETALDNYLTDFDLNMDAQMPTAEQVRVVLDMLRQRANNPNAAIRPKPRYSVSV